MGRGPLRRTLGRDRGDRAADRALTIPTPARACAAWHVGDDGSLAVLLIGPPAVSLAHSLETPKMRPKRRGQSCLRDCETPRIAGGFASASPTLGRLWEREVVGSNPTAPTASGPRVSIGVRSAPSTSARRRPRLAAPFTRGCRANQLAWEGTNQTAANSLCEWDGPPRSSRFWCSPPTAPLWRGFMRQPRVISTAVARRYSR